MGTLDPIISYLKPVRRSIEPADDEIEIQKRFWNDWNATGREARLTQVSEDESRVILKWMSDFARTDLSILDAGCGAGWMSERLLKFGTVTATDLADRVIARAQSRVPKVRFMAGDFMALPISKASYDVIVTLEVLSHVADRPAFVRRLSDLLKPGGVMMMATQNRWVLERSDVQPRGKGQIRYWVNARELRSLLNPHFEIKKLLSITPHGRGGILWLANSVKLNWLLSRIVGDRLLTRAKERAGLGRTLMVYGVKRP